MDKCLRAGYSHAMIQYRFSRSALAW